MNSLPNLVAHSPRVTHVPVQTLFVMNIGGTVLLPERIQSVSSGCVRYRSCHFRGGLYWKYESYGSIGTSRLIVPLQAEAREDE